MFAEPVSRLILMNERVFVCPLGKEINLQQWDTLIFKGEHAENEHWRLVEERNGQVGYAPAAFLMVILDTTTEEEESSATKKGQENSTE